MDVYQEALEMHHKHQGKISVESKVEVNNSRDLSLAYSPGVAEPCREIARDKLNSFKYTSRGNLVAVVSSGTAVLGLGNIGPEAALPVMEGKAVLFKKFAGVDAFPLCVDSTDPDEIVNFVKMVEPTFAGINLEDIAAPDCFYIEDRLQQETDMAIFHDDQHGTAIVTYAGLMNALKLVDKKLSSCKLVVNGAGASATATVKLLIQAGLKEENIIICDSLGVIHEDREQGLTETKKELARLSNPNNLDGDLATAVRGADVFLGLSVGDVLSREMVREMAKDPIVFALANPTPEIAPEAAREAGAKIIATGRSDYPNQINNVLAFPGVLKGALTVRSREINDEMKLAAARAISGLTEKPGAEKIVPEPFEPGIAGEVALATAEAALETGAARIQKSREELVKIMEETTF